MCCTLPDSLGSGTGTLGGSFANVSCAAANVATGAALLGLGLRLGLAVLAGSVLAANGES
jgi:hypothetical protein